MFRCCCSTPTSKLTVSYSHLASYFPPLNNHASFIRELRFLHSAPPRPPHRRVVVTGIGLVTSLGNNREATWKSLLSGHTGISPITTFPTAGLPVKIAAEVSNLNLSEDHLPSTPAFITYAELASDEALSDAELIPAGLSRASRARVGVSIGVGVPHLPTITAAHDQLGGGGRGRRVSPHTVPRLLPNMAAGAVSIRHRLTGPNVAPSTACAAGAHAVADGFRLVQRAEADLVLAGGAEAAVHPIALAGFASARALSRVPARPFDAARDGFSVGEGAGVLVLEELAHARRRGARPYAEVRGVGLSGDGWHVTAPGPEGERAAAAIRAALESGGLDPAEVDYISAHATGTPVGDRVEARVLKDIWGEGPDADGPLVSSVKGSIGHLLGAAGAVEAAVCCLSVKHGIVPPTVGLEKVEEDGFWETGRYVPNSPVEREIRAAISNSFGFGGTNVVISFTQPPP